MMTIQRKNNKKSEQYDICNLIIVELLINIINN